MHSLRLPHEDELARLHAFLPAPPFARYQLATARTEPSPERIIAAGAWWPAHREAPAGPDQAALCCWRVLPRWQADNQLLLAALLEGLTAAATAAGSGSLYTAAMIPETAADTTLLEAHGWTVASRNQFFEGPLEGVGTRLDAIYQRLAGAPEGDAAVGRVRPAVLTTDVLPAVHALVTRRGLVPPDELAHRLSHLDAPGGYSRLGSSVLLTADPIPALAAVVLLRLDAFTAEFDARVADPRVCNAAGMSVPLANLLLLRASLLRLRTAGGGERIRFRAHPQDHRETANFARRCGARLVGTSCAWQYRPSCEQLKKIHAS